MAEILGKWLASDAIDSQVLSNNTFQKGRNNADSADVNMFKVNASDKIEAGAELDMGTFAISNVGNVDGVDVSAKGTNVSNLITLSGVAADSTHLGTFTGTTIPDSQTVKQALQALETQLETVEGAVIEWQNSALDYVVDNTAAPASEVSGDRYILSHDGGAPHADYDGASAGDIVEFNGTSWVATTPIVGYFISADDQATGIYYWGGAAWTFKYFEGTTASTGLTKSGLDIRMADAAASNGIQVSSGAISAVLNSSHLEIASNAISIKSSAIGETELNNADGFVDAQSFVLPTGYTAGAGTVAAADTIDAAIRKLDGNIAAIQTADTELEVKTLVAQDITNQYVDLGFEALVDSCVVWPVGGPIQTPTTDYTLSYTGGAGSVTRLTFAGDLASKLVATDKLAISYLKA